MRLGDANRAADRRQGGDVHREIVGRGAWLSVGVPCLRLL